MVIWDFNSACNNYKDNLDGTGFQMQNTTWQKMLTRDEDYDQRIIDRYRMWREGILSDEYLLNYIDEIVAYLGPAIDRNFEVWGYSFAEYLPLQPVSRNPDTFEKAIQDLKDFIQKRGAWMDEYIEVVQQYGHPSVVKKYNH